MIVKEARMPTEANAQTGLQVLVLRFMCLGLAIGFGVTGIFSTFEPGWIRALVLGSAGFSIVLTLSLPWLLARGPSVVRIAMILLMGAVLTVGLTIQPFQLGTLTGFLFLGIAVGVASYERFEAALILAATAVLFGVLSIVLRSSVFVPATVVFLAVAAMSLIAVFGFRRVAEQSTAAAIADSSKDPLTGAGNRRGMRQRVLELSAAAERSGQRVGCITLDLDRFKLINDIHGHEAGDRVLVATAKRVAEVARRSDPFIRIGGEEFALFTVVGDARELKAIAERLREAIEQLDVVPRVTASIGAAMQRDGVPLDLDDLLQDADRQLYLAKDAGRNAVRMAPTD
jgi:diguanylate cyclase (GGDEF)-like protein